MVLTKNLTDYWELSIPIQALLNSQKPREKQEVGT